MEYAQSAIDEARQMLDQAQSQVDAQIEMILCMKRSRLSLVDAEDALNIMCGVRDRLKIRLLAMTVTVVKPD